MKPPIAASPILLVLASSALGCGAAPTPAPAPAPTQASASPPEADAPPPEPMKEPMETSVACAKAEAQCGGGVCVVSVKNDCDQAVSCDAAMVTACRAGSDLVEAQRRRRETFAAKTAGEVSLQGSCPSGVIFRTSMKSFACK